MKRMRLLLGLCAVLVLGVGGFTASAAAPHQGKCSGGVIAPGVYEGLTVTGDCIIKGEVTINGNVRVTAGAYLDAAYLDTNLTINGNVSVGKGATLGLGCTFGYHDCGLDPVWLGAVTVNGDIIANQALTMYLDFVTIYGNVVSNGGGDASMVDDPGEENGLVFPIKDNVIDGNVTVHGWQGAWFGVIRNTVSNNVIVSHTVGTRVSEDDSSHLDSTEVQTNTISGNLICHRNSPAAQVNANDNGQPNIVGGNKIGECVGL